MSCASIYKVEFEFSTFFRVYNFELFNHCLLCVGSKITIMHWMIKRKIDNWKKQNKQRIDVYTERPLQQRANNNNNNNEGKCERYQFVGCGTEGTVLFIDYKLTDGQQEACLYLKLADGRILTLPSKIRSK